MAAVDRNWTITIRALDGEVQQEIGRVYAATAPIEAIGVFANWDSTANNFFVVRKRGEIVDFNVDSAAAGVTTYGKLLVNGRDVNLAWLHSAIVNTINNRFPQPIKIEGNASVQYKLG